METAAALHFFFPDITVTVTPLGKGNINETLLVTPPEGAPWVLQRLHPGVFANPAGVMANMRLLTAHLAGHTACGLRFFHLGTSPQGVDSFVDRDGCSWRLLSYLDRTRTLQQVTNTDQAVAIGRMLGRFHSLCAELAPERFVDTLPGFHCTPRYLRPYGELRRQAESGSVPERQCAGMIEALRPLATILEDARPELCSQVVHGDPKVANFLFADHGDQAVSLIDLDTVQSGLLLHDLGDCLRSCCNPLGEEQASPEDTTFALDRFAAFLNGYGETGGPLLTKTDRELLADAATVISFELGLRFFVDHLQGDHYFKVRSSGQNLRRAQVQLALAASAQARRPALAALVQRTLI